MLNIQYYYEREYHKKTLERLIDANVRQRLERNRLICDSQHAYLKVRPTETALHEVVGVIERYLEVKQYTLTAFLDKEGAFNNVTTKAIQQALTDLDVEQYINNWVVTILSSRVVMSSLGNSNVSKSVERETPQGGVISPLLWLVVVVYSILVSFDNKGIKVVAIADDVSGKFWT